MAFLSWRGKHSGEARRIVKHTAWARSPCGPAQGGHTRRTQCPVPMTSWGHSARYRKRHSSFICVFPLIWPLSYDCGLVETVDREPGFIFYTLIFKFLTHGHFLQPDSQCWSVTKCIYSTTSQRQILYFLHPYICLALINWSAPLCVNK